MMDVGSSTGAEVQIRASRHNLVITCGQQRQFAACSRLALRAVSQFSLSRRVLAFAAISDALDVSARARAVPFRLVGPCRYTRSLASLPKRHN